MSKLLIEVLALMAVLGAGFSIGRALPSAEHERQISRQAVETFVAFSRERAQMESAVRAARRAGWQPGVSAEEDLLRPETAR